MNDQYNYNFLILDGYPKKSREQFQSVGMTLAGELYAELLLKHLPDASYDLLYTSDEETIIPTSEEMNNYDGVLWPGCNLTVYHKDDDRVQRMLKIVEMAYELGIPQFGSCWAAQIAVYVAGGKVEPNPKGREMGLARKIYLTDDGKKHRMFTGKPRVFDGFISHDDIITEITDRVTILAGNDFSPVQAVEVKYKNGIFWATQYHPEYNLHEMAKLIITRVEKLIGERYFDNHEDMVKHVSRLEQLSNAPDSKNLRWQIGVDDDILDDSIRELEFVNWLKTMIIQQSDSS